MQLAAHAKPRLQPEFKFSTSNPGLACDWKWLPACLLPNSELVERAHGVWSSWAVLVPYSMMNRRLISLVYESTAPPNDAHTRCFYLKSYLDYIDLFWLMADCIHASPEDEWIYFELFMDILSFPQDSVCMWPICRSASGQIIQWIQRKVKTAARNPCNVEMRMLKGRGFRGFSLPLSLQPQPPSTATCLRLSVTPTALRASYLWTHAIGCEVKFWFLLLSAYW